MTAQQAYPHEAPASGVAAGFAASLREALPRFETPRLVVRPAAIEDFAIYRDILMSDRAVYMVSEPMSREAAWLDFSQTLSTWLLRGHGLFAITRKTDGAVLGFTLIGFEVGDQEPELGWFLTDEAEGQGYAFEAAKVVRAWGIDTLELASLVSYIDPPNARSIALAEKLGGTHDPVASETLSKIQGEDVLVYRHWPELNDGGMEAYA